jgi:hypothetical protein
VQHEAVHHLLRLQEVALPGLIQRLQGVVPQAVIQADHTPVAEAVVVVAAVDQDAGANKSMIFY